MTAEQRDAPGPAPSALVGTPRPDGSPELPAPRTVTVPGTTREATTLSVYDTGGDGPAVVLLHGWPDRATLWSHQVAALAAAGYRVIAPDLRGFGDSDRPAEVEHYAMPALCTDVLGLVDALGVDRFALAGTTGVPCSGGPCA